MKVEEAGARRVEQGTCRKDKGAGRRENCRDGRKGMRTEGRGIDAYTTGDVQMNKDG